MGRAVLKLGFLLPGSLILLAHIHTEVFVLRLLGTLPVSPLEGYFKVNLYVNCHLLYPHLHLLLLHIYFLFNYPVKHIIDVKL